MLFRSGVPAPCGASGAPSEVPSASCEAAEISETSEAFEAFETSVTTEPEVLPEVQPESMRTAAAAKIDMYFFIFINLRKAAGKACRPSSSKKSILPAKRAFKIHFLPQLCRGKKHFYPRKCAVCRLCRQTVRAARMFGGKVPTGLFRRSQTAGKACRPISLF